jgi:hypothetical protein
VQTVRFAARSRSPQTVQSAGDGLPLRCTNSFVDQPVEGAVELAVDELL